LPAIAAAIKHEMEHALELSVPIEATLKTGTNWYEVESFDPDDEPVES
jgi:DNA polymerase I-like protein with 3'-5' exonuclease and polymerase domains